MWENTFSLWHKMIKIQSILKELVLVWILRRNITNKIWIYPSIDLYTYMLHKYIQKSLCLYMWGERGGRKYKELTSVITEAEKSEICSW